MHRMRYRSFSTMSLNTLICISSMLIFLSQIKTSLHLFSKFDFTTVGIQKDWIKVKGKYQDVTLLQLVNPNHI